jgi:hypothetical protein
MSETKQPDAPDEPGPKDEFTPEEEEELLELDAQAEEDLRTGNFITWEALFPPKRLVG